MDYITRGLTKAGFLGGLVSLAGQAAAKSISTEASPGLGTLLIRWLLALLG